MQVRNIQKKQREINFEGNIIADLELIHIEKKSLDILIENKVKIYPKSVGRDIRKKRDLKILSL